MTEKNSDIGRFSVSKVTENPKIL